MKSAYERAMERFGSAPIQELSQQQKEQIAEIEKIRTAKMAEAELARDRRIAAAATQEAHEQILEDFRVESASINDRAEQQKQQIRSGA